MLTVNFETDAKTLSELYSALGLDIPVGGTNFLLREDGEPIGLMRTEMGDYVTITHFKLKNDHLNYENREFFLRAMMFKFSLSLIPLAVKGKVDELEKFGFEYRDGYMKIDDSRNINLHGDCHK